MKHLAEVPATMRWTEWAEWITIFGDRRPGRRSKATYLQRRGTLGNDGVHLRNSARVGEAGVRGLLGRRRPRSFGNSCFIDDLRPMMLNTALSEENERRAENVARRHVD